jgi:hypothetical protein
MNADETGKDLGLPDRPRAETWKVSEIVRAAVRGELRVPPFQRGLKWDADDVSMLLDSIYRGYPIGSLLLWRGAAVPDGPVTLGPAVIEAPSRQDVRWIVDGQQRVTALALSLTDRGGDDPRFRIYFDPDNRKFRKETRGGPEPEWLPVCQLLDATALGELLFSWVAGTAERRRAVLEAGARLRDFEVPTYVISSETEEPLREVFRRLNRQGKQLTEPEVFDALAGKGARIADLAPQVAELGWGVVEARVLLTATLVHAGLDPTRKLDEHAEFNASKLSTASLGQAVGAAIRFLRDEADIPHVLTLPYQTPLVVLPAFFHRHPKPSPRTRRLLRRWTWRSFFVDRPSNPRHLREAARAVVDNAESEEQTVERLLQLVPVHRPAPWALTPRVHGRADAAAYRVGLLGLASLGPRVAATGRLVDIGAALTTGHSLPHLVANDPEPWGQTLANRLLHEVLTPEVSGWAEAMLDTDFAASHAVDAVAALAWQNDDKDGFLAARAAAIERVTRALVDGHAEWGADDRPSLRALFAAK